MMLGFDKALSLVTESVGRMETVRAPLASCCGRALAEDVTCDIDMPPFDRSAVDGYALAGAHGSYRIVGTVAAGSPADCVLGPGEAAVIMTGAPVPAGADRILMKEQAAEAGGVVTASAQPAPGDHVCRRAEDIARGDRVLEAGMDIEPRHLGIAAMAGRALLEVVRTPRVGILTTGDEVIPPESDPGPGQVRNANMPMMAGLVTSAGFECAGAIHSPDEAGAMKAAVDRLLGGCDMVLAAGGISVGDRDCVADVLESAGVRFLFREVAMKPGKPLSFGLAGGLPVFGLPGNPVSVMCTFEEFVLPALRRMAGFSRFARLRLRGRSCFDHGQKPGRHNLLRVVAVQGPCWELALPPSSGSGDLMSTVTTNALAHVPEEMASVVPGDDLQFSLYHTAGPDLCFS